MPCPSGESHRQKIKRGIIEGMAYTPPDGHAVDFALVAYTVPDGHAVDFALFVGTTFVPGFYVSGKIGRGPKQTSDNTGTNGIWQMRMTKRGKVPIKMKFYSPTESAARLANPRRTVFADGMAAWGALTTEEKASYTERAKRRAMFGWGLFMRDYLRSH